MTTPAPRRAPEDGLRRGWCPGVARPMETGDGLLVRVHPRGGILAAAGLRALAKAAARHGSGLVDVTGRANLQLRGVRPAEHAALAEALARAGLGDPRSGEGPQRLTLTAPLAGLDPADRLDVRALAEAIEAVEVAGLPPKILVAVEGGGIDLGEAEADLRVVALAPDRVALGLAGPEGTGTTTQWIGAAAPAVVPGAVVRDPGGLRHRARRGAARAGPRCGRPRPPRRRGGARAGPGAGAGAPPRTPARAARRGPHRARRLSCRSGRADAGTLARVAAWSERHGDGHVRLSHRRGLALAGLDLDGAAAVACAARAEGLILFPSDPRRGLAACPGAPACARGTTPTHADAARLALPAAGLGIERCTSRAAPRAAPARAPPRFTLVGEAGRYGIRQSRPGGRDPPRARLDLPAILDALARADHPSRLAETLGVESP